MTRRLDKRRASDADTVSYIFHTLSQPLTALQCALEVSLLTDSSESQLRETIRAAISEADRLQKSLIAIRKKLLNDDFTA